MKNKKDKKKKLSEHKYIVGLYVDELNTSTYFGFDKISDVRMLCKGLDDLGIVYIIAKNLKDKI